MDEANPRPSLRTDHGASSRGAATAGPPGEGHDVNQIDLDGRRAVVTGGAQGIGHAIAERLLRSGAARGAVGP